jgi:hypothetical protein
VPTATPQPGLTIGGPSSHVINEAAGTSYFTIALESEPLSRVKLQLSPRYGSISISPQSVVFDYTNYTSATTFVVTAISNLIEQGISYNDSVIFNVASSDDYGECTAQGRAVCGQAALYSSFKPSRIDVTILDDDTAGVSLSTDFVNVTYDNYGDELTTATYTVALTSKPRSSVTISLGGYGSYTSVSPSSITIDPANWNTEVSVTVSGSAESDDRPVCASGNRFCDALNKRTETISYTVSSSDKYYNGISVSSTTVAAEVVHDLTDPPKITTGKFNNLLNGLTITFNMDTDRAGLTGTFGCSKVFDLTSTQATYYFGKSSYCSFSSHKTLVVTFGKSALVVPGDEIGLKDLLFQSSASSATLFTMNETFVVATPSSPTVPSVVLTASSTYVSVCDDLKLDGSSTTGSGGRAMTYNFSVVPGSPGSEVYNVSEVLALINSYNSGAGTYRATIPSSAMPLGSKLKFKLTASNFLGYSGSEIITVQKLGVPAPKISIQGGTTRSIKRSDKLKIQASAVKIDGFINMHMFC